MRIVMIFIFSYLLLSGYPLDAATTRHIYQAGTVSAFGGNQITIESGTYVLRPEVTVVTIVKDGSGAHYQRPGRLSDVSTGKRVHLKTRGTMVYEIVVER